MRLICVGSAPSSGSTMLADLLDSSPGVICPPELYMFCDPAAYEFDSEFKTRSRARVPYQPKSPYAMMRPFFNDKYFSSTGLHPKSFDQMIGQSDSLAEFVDALAQTQALYRKRELRVFAEKTPININEADAFCRAFPGSLFIHITRDVRTAAPSIMKRGFCHYEAVLIWTYQNWAGLSAEAHPNYRRLRYEDLLVRPFETVALLLSELGHDLDPADIEEGLKLNTYRQGLAVPKSWSALGNRDRLNKPASIDSIAPDKQEIFGKAFLEVSDKNSTSTHIRRLSVNDTLEHLGYERMEPEIEPSESDLADRLSALRAEYHSKSTNIVRQRHICLKLEGEKQPQMPVGASKFAEQGKSLRILQGVTGQAGQPQALAEALRTRGHFAHSCLISEHAFGYKSSINLDIPKGALLADKIASIASIAHNYDIFHFHARSFYLSYGALNYPSIMDMLWLKSIGKKIFFHYRGSEIRKKSQFDRLNPYHFRSEEVEALRIFYEIPQSSKDWLRRIVAGVCDGIFVVDEELREYVGPNAIIVPRAVDDTDLGFTDPPLRKVPIILHAPSRRGVKGTEFVVRAVERLNARGIACELRVIEGIAHSEALHEYRKADIIVDQLRLGTYGVLTTEGLGLGKPVVCYIRDDLWRSYNGELPLANANPDTVEKVLERLIIDLDERSYLGRRAFEYFRRVHRAGAVAERLEYLYGVCNRPREDVDWVCVTRLLDEQIQKSTDQKIEQARNRLKDAHRIKMEKARSEFRDLKREMRDTEQASRKIQRKLEKTIDYRLKKFFKGDQGKS